MYRRKVKSDTNFTVNFFLPKSLNNRSMREKESYEEAESAEPKITFPGPLYLHICPGKGYYPGLVMGNPERGDIISKKPEKKTGIF